MAVDDVRTGGTWVTYVDGNAREMQIRRCRLQVLSGPDKGAQVEVESTWIRVGAQTGCDLALTDRLVSGHHFEMTITLTQQGGKTLVGWRQLFDSAAERERIAPFVIAANEQNLDRLAAEVRNMA